MEAYDKRAGAFEELPAGKLGGFHRAPPLCFLPRGSLHRAQNPRVRAAAAEVSGQRLLDLVVRRSGVGVEQRFGGHDHAVDAIAALKRLFIDESFLQRMKLLCRSESFQSRHRAIANGLNFGHAGTDGFTVHDDRTSAALSEAATEFRPVQLEIVAQNVKQRSVGIDFDDLFFAVYRERNTRHDRLLWLDGERREGFDLILIKGSGIKSR